MPDSIALRVSNKFTIAFWFKSADLNQSQKYLITRQDSGFQDGVIYGYAANQVEFFGTHSGADPRTGSQITLPDNGWHHIAYTYDGTNWAGYLDGTRIFNVTRSFTLSGNSAPWYFGSADSAGYVNANLDDIRIYNRALSMSEIAALAEGNQAVTPSPTPTFAATATPTRALSDLQILKIAKLDKLGKRITFTLKVSNQGTVPPDRVTVRDNLSPAIQFGSVSSTKGKCVYGEARRVVRCSVGALNPNQSATIKIVVKWTASPVAFTNCARVKSKLTPDADPDNNRSCANVQVNTTSLHLDDSGAPSAANRSPDLWSSFWEALTGWLSVQSGWSSALSIIYARSDSQREGVSPHVALLILKLGSTEIAAR